MLVRRRAAKRTKNMISVVTVAKATPVHMRARVAPLIAAATTLVTSGPRRRA
jgi:hypothetical protein